jgi:cathepsin D
LAFKSISHFASDTKSFFENLISEGVVTSPIFGFKLAPNGSELFLGGFNPDYKEDDFTWLPVSADGVCWIINCVKCVSNASFALIGFLGILRDYHYHCRGGRTH